ncbi:MAG: glycosyltransferase family 1 protein [Planctomycetota bacterium]
MNRATGGHDVICFCGTDWWYQNRAHSDFQWMTRVARTRKVLAVNSIGMRMPMPGKSTMPFRRIWRKVRSAMRGLRRPLPDVPGFAVMTPALIPFYGNATARRWNARLVRAQVERAARRLGIVSPHVIVTPPTAFDVAKDMPRATLAYNRSDRHAAFAEAPGGLIADLEEKLFRTADLVLYSSRALLEAERARVGDRGRFLDHGIDLERFRSCRCRRGALEARGIRRPIVGFFGGIENYVVDIDLLERVAVAHPEWSLVLIGDAALPMDRLTRHPNVHWLGFRPYEEIPRLGADFDVALMPWLDNDWISACNPIKLKEYLALGLEIVTTPFPEAEHYRDLLHIARGPRDFVAAIEAVLGGRRAGGDRDAVLERADWQARADELLDLLDAAAARASGGLRA